MLLRFGHFNIRDLTLEKLLDPQNSQARAAADIIKRFRPDVLSINEMECSEEAPEAFARNFLLSGTDGLEYPYFYMGRTNSGLPTGLPPPFDFKGFGAFEGQYGIALLSRLPVIREGAKDYLSFSWGALQGGRLVESGETVPEGFPLFTTGFFDIPIEAAGRLIRVILLHACIPVRGYLSKERNADQIRFLRAYINRSLPGVEGGVPPGEPFVIMGDLNADSEKGEGIRQEIRQLLEDPLIIYQRPPESTFLEGGGRQEPLAKPLLDREGFQLRLDYILPSRGAFRVRALRVFWPEDEPWWEKARTASDHFFLYADCELI